MDICVLIRGDIGSKAYQAWATQVPKKFLGCSISHIFRPTCQFLVTAKATTEESLLTWTKGVTPSDQTVIVSPDWMISSLKSGKLLSASNFVLSHLFTNKPGEGTNIGMEEDNSYNVESLVVGAISSFSRSPGRVEIPRAPLTIDPSQPHDADETNKNSHITTILDELQAMYLMGDQFRAINYKKSSSYLKRLPRIDNVVDLSGIQGFGKSLKTTISEILQTGSLRKLQHLKKNPRSTAITVLSEIWGVGEKTAEQFFNQGFHSIADIRTRGKHLLNRQQLVGLKHYEDFLIKIPRAEVDEIANIVTEECKRIEPDAECTVCGSYRRGKSECGDVDILITPVEGRADLPAHTLSQLLEALSRRGFLTDHLSLPTGHREYVETSALEALQHVASSTSPGQSLSGSSVRGSVRGSVRSGASGTRPAASQGFTQSQSLSQSQSLTQSQSQFMSQSSFGSPPSATFGTASDFGPTQDTEFGSEDEWAFNDEDASDQESICDEHGDGNDSAGTQFGAELGPGEPVKYDTYGGKKRRSEHRLYHGSRSSYMGVCRVPHPGALHRRIDIKIYPRHQKGFALFYFTGSDAFNRGVRFYVARNNLALDDKGLMRCVRDSSYKIVTRGELIPCATEHDIFETLGLAYREPWERPLFDRKSMILRPIQQTRAGSKAAGTGLRSTASLGNYNSQFEASQLSPLSSPEGRSSQADGRSQVGSETSALGKRPHQD